MLCWKCLEKGKGSGQSGSFTCMFLPGLSVFLNVSTTPLSTDSAWDTFLPSTLHSYFQTNGPRICMEHDGGRMAGPFQ